MKVKLTGYKENKDNTGCSVFGVIVDDILGIVGNSVFDEYIRGFKGSSLELGEIYEVEFEQYKFKGQFISRVIGLRKD